MLSYIKRYFIIAFEVTNALVGKQRYNYIRKVFSNGRP